METDAIILFIDELHAIIGSGSGIDDFESAGILKPALARGAASYGWSSNYKLSTREAYWKDAVFLAVLLDYNRGASVAEAVIFRPTVVLWRTNRVTITDEGSWDSSQRADPPWLGKNLQLTIDLLDEAVPATVQRSYVIQKAKHF